MWMEKYYQVKGIVHYMTHDGSYEAELYTDFINVTLGHSEFLVEWKLRKNRQKNKAYWLQIHAAVATKTYSSDYNYLRCD